MKVGVGKHGSDKDINLSTRGTIEALSVEIVDSSGNQVTSFVPTNFIDFEYDGGSVAYPSDTQEVYTFTLSNVTVATVTFNYTDSIKNKLSSWTKT